MKLEIGSFHVKDIVFGKKTTFENGILTVDEKEAIAVLNPEGKLKNVKLHIAHPGESVRFVPIKAAVKPCARPDGRAAFPGYTGKIAQAGEGTMYDLLDMCVLAVGKYGGWMEAILDMSGPMAELTPYSKLTILAFSAETTDPGDDCGDTQKTNHHYRLGAHLLAEYLGRTVLQQIPESKETFQLTECADKELPRVMLSVMMSSFYNKCPGYNEVLYGQDVIYNIPTLLHPNEFLDGAVTSSSLVPGSSHIHTYEYQSFPILRKLYAEHGKTINFVGVTNMLIGDNLDRKNDYAIRIATMARMLKVDAAILCEQGSGNGDIDFFTTLVSLEKVGIKTVAMAIESPGRDGYTQSKGMLDGRGNAFVTTGNNQQITEFPAMETVVGDIQSVVRDMFTGFWKDDALYGPSLRSDGSIIGDTHSILGYDGTLGSSIKMGKNY